MHTLESCVVEIQTWMAAIKLCLNDSKTEFVVIRSQVLTSHKDGGLTLGCTQATALPVVRNLGVLMDQALFNEMHIHKLSSCTSPLA